MWWFHYSDFHLYEHLCTNDYYLPSDLHRTCRTIGKPDLPNEYHRGSLPVPSGNQYRVFDLVGYGIREWRLQRSFDEQQYGSAFSLRWQHYGDLHLYERLCTADDDMYGDLHGTCGPNGSADLPHEYHCRGLPNTGSSK